MQTAIQQMIDFINDINDNDSSDFNYYYDSIIGKLNELLEVEKQQIVDALETGWVMGCSKEAGKVLRTHDKTFSERWGLKIEERKLTFEERQDLYEEKYMFTKSIEEVGIDYKYNVPTKLITVTYKDKTIEVYE